MEHAPAQRLAEAVLRPEPQGKDQCPQGLHAQAADQNGALKLYHAVHIVERHGLGHDHALLQSHLPAQQKNHQGGGGHKAQAADLDQGQQDNLAETAPLAPGIEGRQTRDTGGRGGGK